MNSNEHRNEKIYKDLIDRAGKSLLEVYNALWIYDFNKVHEIVFETINNIDRGLQKVGLTVRSLISKE